MVRKLEVNLSNKVFYTLVAVSVIIVLGVVVYAYGGAYGDPAIMGHTADEIEGGGGGGSVPAGAVMAFYLATCPSGWSPADGTAGNPDLRGMFIRGKNSFDNDVTVRSDGHEDPDGLRTLGSFQDDLFEAHNHNAWRSTSSQIWYGGLYGAYGSGRYVQTYATTQGGAETRPKNIALIYCVKD